MTRHLYAELPNDEYAEKMHVLRPTFLKPRWMHVLKKTKRITEIAGSIFILKRAGTFLRRSIVIGTLVSCPVMKAANSIGNTGKQYWVKQIYLPLQQEMLKAEEKLFPFMTAEK